MFSGQGLEGADRRYTYLNGGAGWPLVDIDEKVSAGVKNIAEAYDLQDRLLRELYDVTQSLHERTRLALEFSGSRDTETLERLLRRHEALGAAIREFYQSSENHN